MDRRGGSVIRTLAHQLLSPAECSVLKTSIKEFRQHTSVPALITSLKPVINTTERMLLLVEISYIMPSRLKDDFNKLCALHFDGYRHVLMSSNPAFRSESPSEVIAQNTSGSVQIVSSPSQKKLLVKEHKMKDFHTHNMNDIRLDEVAPPTDITTGYTGKYKTLPVHGSTHPVTSNHAQTLPNTKAGKTLERNNHELIKHLAQEQMGNDNQGICKNNEMKRSGSEPRSSRSEPRSNQPVLLHRGETDMIVSRVVQEMEPKRVEAPRSLSEGSAGSHRDTEGSQHSGEHPAETRVPQLGGRERRRRRRIRKVELARQDGVSLGFSIRGNTRTGIFVSDVDVGSQADVQGLRVGDRILKVNDVALKDTSHSQAACLIRDLQTMVLYVTSDLSHRMPALSAGAEEREPTPAQKVVSVKADPDGWLGCSIRGGVDYRLGVVISNVDPMSPAQRAGLRKGDIILQMNGVDVAGLTHMEVVTLATSTPDLELLIKPVSRKSQKARSLAHLADGQSTGRQRRPVARHNSSPSRPQVAPPTPPSSPLRWMRTEDLQQFEEELQRTPPVISSTPMPPIEHPPPDYLNNEDSVVENNAVEKQIKEDEKLARMLSGTLRNNMLHSTIEDDVSKCGDLKAANSPSREDVRNLFNARQAGDGSAKRNLTEQFGTARFSGQIIDLQHELSRESQRAKDVVLHLHPTPESHKQSRNRSVSPGGHRSRDPRRRSQSQPRAPPSGAACFDVRSSPNYQRSPAITPGKKRQSRQRAVVGVMSSALLQRNRALQLAVSSPQGQGSDDEWML